jgi:SAM-dependent methyltransferase
MAHESQLNFIYSVKHRYPHFFTNTKVLEIGSVDINGSARQFFYESQYTGIDVYPGSGVDRVCFGHEVDDPDESYDTVLSEECFEHDMYWDKTFKNMIRLCKKGGLVFFTCAAPGRHEHGTNRTSPQDSLTCKLGSLGDYYRNLQESDFREFINFEELFSEHKFLTNENPCDLYFYGIKS